MTKTFILLLAPLAFTAVAQDVRYNFDEQADFGKYHTYKLVEARGSQPLDDLNKKQLTDVIQQELAKKGFTLASGDNSDVVVSYQVAISTEKQINTWNDGWGMGPGWRGGWAGAPTMSQSTTSTLYVGELALDMYDASKKQLVWRAVASKTIDVKAKPEKREKNLHKALEKMLKKYPPKK